MPADEDQPHPPVTFRRPAEAASRFLRTWAPAQASSFTVEDAIAAASAAGAGPSETRPTSALLAADPDLACVAGRFYSARVLAGLCRFLVRLTSFEREQNVFIPGHRFLPFVDSATEPGSLRLEWFDGRPLEPRRIQAPRALVEMCLRLYGPARADAFLAEPGDPVAVPAFRLPDAAGFGEEFLVTCFDFDTKTYCLAPHREASPPERRAHEEMLHRALREMLEDPPPGTVTAPRQFLHVVAACLDSLCGRPVGPLAPAMTADPGIRIAVSDGAACFVAVAPPAVPPPAEAALAARALSTAAASPSNMAEAASATGHADAASLAAPTRGAPAHTEPATPPSSDPEASSPAPSSSGETATAAVRGVPAHSSSGEAATATVHGVPAPSSPGDAATAAVHGTPAPSSSGDMATAVVHGVPAPSSSGDSCAPAVRETARPADPAPEPARGSPAAPASSPGEWTSVFRRLDALLQSASAPGAAEPPAGRIAWRIWIDPASPRITPWAQKPTREGWTRGRPILPHAIERGAEPWLLPADQAAARRLIPLAGAASARFDLFELLECLVRHPYVFWDDEGDRPVRIDADDLRLRVEVGASGAIGLLPAAGGLVGGRGAAAYLHSRGLVLVDRDGGRVVLGRATPLAVTLLQELHIGARVIPPEAAEALLARIPLLSGVLPIDLPPALQGDEAEADGRILLRLTPERGQGLAIAMRVRPLPSEACVFRPGDGPSEVRAVVEHRRLFARRDLAAEAERARGLRDSLGLDRYPEQTPWDWRILDDETALDLVESLRPRPREGLVVEWPAGVSGLPTVRVVGIDRLRVTISEDGDAFGVDGSIDVDGVLVSLARILDRLRAGRKYVPIGDGKWLKISDFLAARLRSLAQSGPAGTARVQVDRTAAPALAEWLREAGTVQACRAWNELLGRFDEAMHLAPDPPAGLHAELREYQLEGYRWLCRLAAWGVGGVLADDMGLGKTVQTLAALVARAADGPALIVCPSSVEFNWEREARRFCPMLQPVLYRDSGRAQGGHGPGDLVIASYGMVLRDAERLHAIPWHTLVLDEAQMLKNSHTKTAQAVRALRAPWRLALTGTPVENRLGDLWSLFRAVCPGLLGSRERFQQRFVGPITRGDDPAPRTELAQLIRPFLLRRTKAEVLHELPARTEIPLAAELSPEERELYDAARLRAADRLEQGRGLAESDRRFQALAAITELRQLACNPKLVYPDLEVGSTKMRLFLETAEELIAGGHRALVFSQFTRHLGLVRRELDGRGIRYLYLDGDTPQRQRRERVDAFQRGEAELFLISLKAGGTGLNLTAADYVIHLDPWWNPAVEDQATDRAHRIGQTRPVIVYRLIAVDTIEDRIVALHADKRDLVAGILEGADQAAKLSIEELIDLVRTGGAGR